MFDTGTDAKTTPKRKRGQEMTLTPMPFSFDSSTITDPTDGGSSPRSKVANKFQGLAIHGGGGAGHKVEMVVSGQALNEIQERSTVNKAIEGSGRDDDAVPMAESKGATETDVTYTEAGLEDGDLQHSYPSINRLADSVSRRIRRKRSGTPPLRSRDGTPRTGNDEDMEICDPVRAALTWHEDEITIYDPNDADDDGTGINGVGFKPAPAHAQARAMRRKQQLAEYRKREESEARARRSQRRREPAEATPKVAEQDDGSPCRKVRFTEANHRNAAVSIIE